MLPITRNHLSSFARIENEFIFKAEYQLTAREQKVILYLVSMVDPMGKRFGMHVVPFKDIKELIMSKRSGSFYEEMEKFAKGISKKQIIFDSKVKGKRKKKMQGVINWFASIEPVYNEKGEVCLEFEFSKKLAPVLLQLKEYTQIDYLQTIPLGSGFSVRMYQIFRAYRDKMAKHQKRSKLKYELNELKIVLGVEGKYKDWRKFKERVVAVIEKEINEHTDIRVQTNLIREGRKVVALEFELWDKGSRTKTAKTIYPSLRFEKLTFAQRKAYTKLVGFGIEDGIALEMLSRVGGSETNGFEDWYFEEVIKIFESKTNQEGEAAKAGTLVNWFTKKKVFEQGDMFARIIEAIQARKKALETARPAAYDNRLKARNMTSQEFTSQYQ